MKVIEDLSVIEKPRNAVVTSGTFDGVHQGHQKILRKLINSAKEVNGETVVVTYWPHPRAVLGNGWGDLRLLTTFEEKAHLLAENGIDYLVKIPFTRTFSELSSKDFIQNLLVGRLGTHKLIIGYDHKFGKNRESGFEYLKENQSFFGFEVEEIPRHDIDSVGVSSTEIRKALFDGEVEEAQKLLGRPYTLSGIVIKGDQFGRQLGYPTANIYIAEEFKLIPRDGVYAMMVHLKSGIYQGMMNIGIRPTISGKRRQIEVNIFEFEEDIYGQSIKLEFVSRLREERRFESKDHLKEQLGRDKIAALSVFADR